MPEVTVFDKDQKKKMGKAAKAFAVMGGGPIGALAYGMRKRRQKRKKNKESTKYLGGSKKEEQRLYDESGERTEESRGRSEEAYGETKTELKNARKKQELENWRYGNDSNEAREGVDKADAAIDDIGTATGQADSTLAAAQDGASGIRQNALATNSLVGSTDSVLTQRAAQIGATPTIGSATEAALTAQRANAQAANANATQMINRQAMGVAAAQGEGGALAAQQAIASAVRAGGAQAAGTNLALSDQAAQLRFNAALAQREQDLAEAAYASDARLGAVGAEREAQLGFADKSAVDAINTGAARAELGYGSAVQQQAARAGVAGQRQQTASLSSGRDQFYQGQRSGVAAQNAATATEAEGSDKEYQSGLLTAKFGAQQSREERPMWKKALSPSGIIGGSL